MRQFDLKTLREYRWIKLWRHHNVNKFLFLINFKSSIAFSYIKWASSQHINDLLVMKTAFWTTNIFVSNCKDLIYAPHFANEIYFHVTPDTVKSIELFASLFQMFWRCSLRKTWGIQFRDSKQLDKDAKVISIRRPGNSKAIELKGRQKKA